MMKYLQIGVGTIPRAVIPCALALLAAVSGRADTIVAPGDYNSSTSFAGWDFGCGVEFGCGSDESFGPVAGNFLNNDLTFQPTGYLTATIPVAGASFSYSEIDDANGNPLDFFAFNNGNATGPVTFTFADTTNTVPQGVDEFATTLYSPGNPFTAYVSAYNAQNQLLGTTSASAVADPGDTCAFGFGCYSAFVGVQDIGGPDDNIASVVISTTAPDSSQDNWFAFGTVGVASTPEPGTWVLMLLGAAGCFAGKARFRKSSSMGSR